MSSKEIVSHNNEDIYLKKIYEGLKEEGYVDKYPNLKIIKIKENIYAVDATGNTIWIFVDKKGEVILNISSMVNQYYFKTASILAGYTEVKQEDGTYKLYKIGSIDINTKEIKPEKVVNKYSEEYFNAWMDIAFYSISMSTKLFLKKSTDGLYNELDSEWLSVALRTKTLKILDLHLFYKQEQITEDLFKKSLPQVQTLLLEQIGDRRFERVGRQITKEEIEFYKKENLISSELYELAIQQLAEVEKLRQQEAKEKKREVMRKNIRGAMDDVMGKL